MLTVSEAANRLRVTRQTVYNKLQSGVWHGVKVGREWRISENEIRRLEGYKVIEYREFKWEMCDRCAESCLDGRKYCPHCGRPLTEEAWEQLYKRLKEIMK